MKIKTKYLELGIVGLVLVLGFALRIAFINHGLPNFESPDEVDFVGPALNLTFNLPEALKTHNLKLLDTDYFYGHPHGYTNILFVGFTLTKEVAQLLGVNVHAWSRADFFVIGRIITVIFSTATIFVVWLLARRFFGRKVALVSLIISSFFYYFIIYAHSSSPYPVNSFFIVTFLYFWLKYAEDLKIKSLLLSAFLLGMCAATNFGSVILLIPISIVFAIQIYQKLLSPVAFLKRFCLLGIISLLIFFVLAPFTLINYQITIQSLHSLSLIQQSGCVYSTSRFGLWHYFFLPPEVSSGLSSLNISSITDVSGLAFALLALISLALAIFAKNKYLFIINLTFLGAILLYIWPASKTLRWLLPFLPLLIIVAGNFVVNLFNHRVFNILLWPCLLLLIFPSLFNIYIFLKAYQSTDTRELALEWFLENVPKDTAILRPTNYSPPIWRYGYINDRSVSHPGCSTSKELLQASNPGNLDQYICNRNNPNIKTQYIMAIDSVVNPVLSTQAKQNFPQLYSSWNKLYSTIFSFPIAVEFTTSLNNPRTGPNITVYQVPNFDCSDYFNKYPPI